ncbi:MAG: lamin tail domain-containing protein [Bacteroidota bacterium]
MKKLVLFVLISLSFSLKAQLTETFTDGDFLNNPAWFGDTSDFKITSSTAIPTAMRPALQLNTTIAGNSCIVTANPMILDNNEWDFWIKLSFNPTANNNARVYLVSDQSNLKDALNGYYLGIGETNDRITFCIQNGLVVTILISGTIANLNKTNNQLRIQVKRSNSGLWQIYSDTLGGTNFLLEAGITETTFTTGNYFGFNCLYTVSNSTKFYFDDIYAGDIFVDTISPKALNVSTITPSKLDVMFSENLDQISAENILNYGVDNGINNPVTAVQDVVNKSLIHLSFAQSFITNTNYTITINNVKDINNNVMIMDTLSFNYSDVINNDINKVLINEIMADVNPVPNQLPACDYIELYNRSNDVVNLNQWAFKLKDAGDTLYFSDITLQPNSYLVICDDGDVSLFSSFCQNIYSFNSFIINNETTVTLYNPSGNIEHQITYDLSWYHNSIKSQGGWSLEQIDPQNPCGGINNWKASYDSKGGTPGKKNAVYAVNPDLIPPFISKICVEDSNFIKIYFNEAMDKSKLLNTAAYHIQPTLNIDTIINHQNELDAIELKLSDSIIIGQIYTLTITDSISDCVGNIIPINTISHFAYPEAPDINDIIINEILFNPKPDGVDFVEIYNRSSKNISLAMLYLSGYDTYLNSLKYMYPITLSCDIISKKEYLVLTINPSIVKQQYNTQSPDNFISMNSIPALNNDMGIIVLAKADSTIIDRFDYNVSMHFPLLIDVAGVSLERINPDKATQDRTNWHSASEQSGFATPSYQNSQYSDFLYLEDPFTISPDVFSPDNDGHNDVLQINYKFTLPGLLANILIYDSKGRLIKNLIKNELMGTKGTILWDGISDANTKAIIGIYVLYIEVFDLKGNVKQFKKTAVLGGKL